MVPFVAGLAGVILVTVDTSALGMTEVERRLHRETITLTIWAEMITDLMRV